MNNAPSTFEMASAEPFAASTVPPARLNAVSALTLLPDITWPSSTFVNASVSASSASIAPLPSAAKASSVGANTVNVEDSSASTASSPLASSAATSVVKLPALTAVSTIFAVATESSSVPSSWRTESSTLIMTEPESVPSSSVLSQAASATSEMATKADLMLIGIAFFRFTFNMVVRCGILI